VLYVFAALFVIYHVIVFTRFCSRKFVLGILFSEFCSCNFCSRNFVSLLFQLTINLLPVNHEPFFPLSYYIVRDFLETTSAGQEVITGEVFIQNVFNAYMFDVE